MKFNVKHFSLLVMLLVSNYLFGQSISSRPALQTLFTTGSTLTQAKMYSFLNSYVHKNDSAPTYSALVRQDTTHPISYVRFPFSTILGRLSSGNVVAIPFTTLKTAVGLNTILKGAGVPSNSIGVAGDIYYDTVGHYLYNPKTTVWVNRTQLVGTNGTNGSPGANGTNGTNGAAGANGTNGNTVLNGNTAPSNGTGNNGDFFLNTATSYIYGPKASGTWPSGVSLVGPAGTNGTNGTNGAQGSGYYGTITTSAAFVAVNATLTISTQAGLAEVSGGLVRVSEIPAKYMQGTILSYSGTTMVITVTKVAGTGTLASGSAIALVGMDGVNYSSATSVTSPTITVGGNTTFTIGANLPFQNGNYVTVYQDASNSCYGQIVGYTASSGLAVVNIISTYIGGTSGATGTLANGSSFSLSGPIGIGVVSGMGVIYTIGASVTGWTERGDITGAPPTYHWYIKN